MLVNNSSEPIPIRARVELTYGVYDRLLCTCDNVIGGVVRVADNHSLESRSDRHGIGREECQDEGDECEAHGR